MERVPIVNRQLPRMIELVAVNYDFRLEFCGDSRPGMKRRHVIHCAIVRRSDIHWHLVSVRILASVESDVDFILRDHYRDQ
jgi:hypothetical protein